jgi:hypothetical protein
MSDSLNFCRSLDLHQAILASSTIDQITKARSDVPNYRRLHGSFEIFLNGCGRSIVVELQVQIVVKKGRCGPTHHCSACIEMMPSSGGGGGGARC